MTLTTSLATHYELPVLDQKDAALDMLDDAWVEAVRTGVNVEVVSHAALFKSVATLVDLYGEDAVSMFMETLSQRVAHGEFSMDLTRH